MNKEERLRDTVNMFMSSEIDWITMTLLREKCQCSVTRKMAIEEAKKTGRHISYFRTQPRFAK